MGDRTKPLPEGWGGDHLTEFLETAEHNRFATFVRMADGYAKLNQVDALFMKPSLSRWRVRDEEMFRAGLFHRAHGFYRTACGAVMAGQIAEAFSMCRAVLEAAAYALHMAKTPGLDAVWRDRHENGGMQAVKKGFALKAIRKSIASLDVRTDERFARLYQEAIDMGAHPNARSVFASLEISETQGEYNIRSLLLNPAGNSQKYAMKAVAQAGACAIEMFLEVFPERSVELDLQQDFKIASQGL